MYSRVDATLSRGKRLWSDSNGKNKLDTWTPLKGPFGREFSAFVIISELWQHEVAKCGNFVSNFCFFLFFFWKTIHLKLSLVRGSRPKAARTTPHIWLILFQISSKSLYFRRSYCRMREYRFWPVEYLQYKLFEPRKILRRLSHNKWSRL